MATLHRVGDGCGNPQRKADVVFIHGLGGDAWGTWRHGDNTDDDSWPHWLAQAYPDVGVWTLAHAASPTAHARWWSWLKFWEAKDRSAGVGAALPRSAKEVADLMRLEPGFTENRPLIFVCHSLGGLLAKQILRTANENQEQADVRAIAQRTRAVMFIGTPHSGAPLASMAKAFATVLGATPSLTALEAHEANLEALYDWYRGHAGPLNIRTESYYEGRGIFGVVIVNPTTAQAGIGPATPLNEEDHISIAKPSEPTRQLCRALERLLRDVCPGLPPPLPIVRGAARAAQRDDAQDTDGDAADRDAESDPPAQREVSPIPPALRPPDHTFRGRAALLDTLIQRLRAGSSTTVIGDAGMGKTALAVEALQRLLGRDPAAQRTALAGSAFPDGVLMLDLYRHHGRAELAWSALADDLGVPTQDAAGQSISAQQRAIRGCTGKRLLLVVEGGEEADGGHAAGTVLAGVDGVEAIDTSSTARATPDALLAPLALAGPVLWLTRRGDQRPAIQTLHLDDALGDDDARALFEELTADPVTRAPRVAPAIRDRALGLLHGHPLGITWAAGLLAAGNVTAADLLDDLATQPSLSLHQPEEKEHTLHWLFGRSLRALDPDARRSLLAAGLLAHAPFPRAAIAAATGLDDPAQRRALEACLAARLLRSDLAADTPRYGFGHALAYRYAREQARAAGTVAEQLAGLAQWAHAALMEGIAVGAGPAAMEQVEATLAHALAVVEADAASGLWQPLVNGLLYGIGDRFVELGRLPLARRPREAVERWVAHARQRQPNQMDWLHQAAICQERLGSLDFVEGRLTQAQSRHVQALAIRERLAAQDAGNAKGQRNLSVSHVKLGEVQQAQGDLPGAHSRYAAGLVIAERLVAQDAGNSQWQRDLSVIYERFGDVQQAQGDLPGAQLRYAAGLAIAERLAAQDAGNAQWQRDLGVSYVKLGEVQRAQGDLPGAQSRYAAALAIAERLAAQDAGNAQWQRDLGVTYIMLGDVQQAQGDLPGARSRYAAGLAIAERLAVQDAGNAQWQRDLSVSYEKLGDVQQAQGDLPGARSRYAAALVIRERLAVQDAGNAQWQRDLAVSQVKLNKLCEARGDVAGALAHLRAAREVLSALCRRAPDHPQFQRDLAWVESAIAKLEQAPPPAGDAA